MDKIDVDVNVNIVLVVILLLPLLQIQYNIANILVVVLCSTLYDNCDYFLFDSSCYPKMNK